MTSSIANSPNGKAISIKKTFSLETSVNILINADPAIIWTLLTNAADFSRWNSTVISILGEIKLGKKIQLVSTLDPKRTFKIKVKEIKPEKQMVWGDNNGSRTFSLEKQQENQVKFTMYEKMGGLMFPLYARFLPPFESSFEDFAMDLKKEAEQIHNLKN